MKLLISGATGFVGKHLIRRLRGDYGLCAIVRPSSDVTTLDKEKVKYYVFDGNVQNLIIFLKKEEFSGVVHLASTFLARHEPDNIRSLVDSNILFSTILLDAAVNSGISWFINTGTFWQHYQDKKYSPVNLYAATKQAFEDIAQYYLETSPINFVTVKLCDTFGPDDTRPKIFNLWSKLNKTGETLDMSPGEQIIDISYIDNVIDGYVKLISLVSKDAKKKLAGQTFAIGSGRRMSLKKLAKLFEQTTGRKLRINWGGKPYRPREVMIPWTKGKKIPGWQPKVNTEEGIMKTINNE